MADYPLLYLTIYLISIGISFIWLLAYIPENKVDFFSLTIISLCSLMGPVTVFFLLASLLIPGEDDGL